MAHPRKRVSRPDLLSIIATTGVVAFIIVVIVLIIVRQDYNPVKRYLSEYAVGPYGWVMQIAFCLLSLASFALALGLWSKGFDSGRSQLDIILLGIWSGGGFVAGIFPVDLQGTPLTFVGAVHLVSSSIALLSLFVAMVVFGIKFRKDPSWVGISLPAVVLLYWLQLVSSPKQSTLVQQEYLG